MLRGIKVRLVILANNIAQILYTLMPLPLSV